MVVRGFSMIEAGASWSGYCPAANCDDSCQRDGDSSGQQAELAKVMNNERLKIEQPECCEKHEGNNQDKQFSDKLVTKRCERCETEHCEIGGGAD
jgi:hypothetical protein